MQRKSYDRYRTTMNRIAWRRLGKDEKGPAMEWPGEATSSNGIARWRHDTSRLAKEKRREATREAAKEWRSNARNGIAKAMSSDTLICKEKDTQRQDRLRKGEATIRPESKRKGMAWIGKAKEAYRSVQTRYAKAQ